MPRYFFSDSPLCEVERMMQQQPNYRPRGGGLTDVSKTAPANMMYATHGRWAQEIVKSVNVEALIERTRRLIPPETRSPYADATHRSRMYYYTATVNRDVVPNIAAVYLMAADRVLSFKARRALKNGCIDFAMIEPHGFNYWQYRLLRTAEDLQNGRWHIKVDELCDPAETSDDLFRLISLHQGVPRRVRQSRYGRIPAGYHPKSGSRPEYGSPKPF